MMQRVVGTLFRNTNRICCSARTYCDNGDGQTAQKAPFYESSLNRVTLMGRLGKDVEMKRIGNNVVATANIATNAFTYEAGVVTRATLWHKIAAVRPKVVERFDFLRKGDRVLVEGSLEYRRMENYLGEEKMMSVVVVGNVILLGHSRKQNTDESPQSIKGAKNTESFSDDEDEKLFEKEDLI